MIRNMLCSAAVILPVLLADSAAYAQDKTTLRYASPLGPTTSMMVGAQWWMDEVSKRTDGRVEFRTFFAGSLVGPSETLAAVQSGRVDMGYFAPVYSPSEFPLWMITSLPFMTDNAVAQVNALGELNEGSEPFKAELERNGIRVVLFHPVSPAATGTKEPLPTPADYKGKSLRALGLIAEAITAVGAEPIAISPGEIYEGIERGVIDGYASVAFDTIVDLGLHEVAPHVTHPHIGVFASAALGVNTSVWDELPDDVKQVMGEVAQELMAEKSVQILSELDERACNAIKGVNGSVTVYSEDAIEEWSGTVRPKALEQWRTTALASLDEEQVQSFETVYIEALERHAAAVSYRDGMSTCADTME